MFRKAVRKPAFIELYLIYVDIFFFLQKIEVFMIREYREICDLNNIVCT